MRLRPDSRGCATAPLGMTMRYRSARNDNRIIIRSMSGFLTRAESRALRMTAENGECALEFTRLLPCLRLSRGTFTIPCSRP